MKCRNFDGTVIHITAGTADTEFSVSHECSFTPLEAFVARRGGNSDLYKSGTAWTDTLAYFKASASNAQFWVIFFR